MLTGSRSQWRTPPRVYCSMIAFEPSARITRPSADTWLESYAPVVRPTQRVNNEGTHTNWFLRWNQTAKATDSMWETRRLLSSITWDLHVSWDGVAFEQENEQYHLIDNAYAYVELKDPSQSLSLDVSGA